MTKLCLAIATLGALAAGSASATPSLSCVALGRGPTRVAATVARPEDCCSGRMQCAQFLSTVTVVRPGGDQHT